MELHDCDRRRRPKGRGRKSISPNPVDQIEDFLGSGVDTSVRRVLAIFGAEKATAAEDLKTDVGVQRGRKSTEMEHYSEILRSI